MLVFGLAVLLAPRALAAAERHAWVVKSPTHEQTYAYGSERHQAWMARGDDRHLALSTEFTNDPYVDKIELRQYDDFVFDFPAITLGRDGHTFYYHSPGGRSIPVAVRHPGFLGIDEVRLLDNTFLLVEKPHGYLSLSLIVQDHPFPHMDEASL